MFLVTIAKNTASQSMNFSRMCFCCSPNEINDDQHVERNLSSADVTDEGKDSVLRQAHNELLIDTRAEMKEAAKGMRNCSRSCYL